MSMLENIHKLQLITLLNNFEIISGNFFRRMTTKAEIVLK